MDNTTKTILAVAGVGTLGFLLFSGKGTGLVSIPNGTVYNGYQNSSGTTVWLNAAGQIVNALGQVLATFSHGNWGTGGGSSSSGGSTYTGGAFDSNENFDPFSDSGGPSNSSDSGLWV